MTNEGEINHPVHAKLYDRLNAGAEEKVFPPHRNYLAAGLEGDVLDVGIGTGSMIPYYVASRQQGSAFDLRAIEPDPDMRRQAMEAAHSAEIPVEITTGRAEQTPYPDDSFDVVICSLVLCSVEDLEDALSEIARVLRPEGEFRFFEHVRSDGVRGTIESFVSPVWRPVAAGCRIDRRTGDRIAERFEPIEIDRFDIGTLDTFPARRFVRGRALHR